MNVGDKGLSKRWVEVGQKIVGEIELKELRSGRLWSSLNVWVKIWINSGEGSEKSFRQGLEKV